MRFVAIVGLMVVAIVVLLSCAPLDAFFGVDATGVDQPGPSAAEGTGELVDGLLGPPWGQIVLSGIILIQNGYMLARRIQSRIKKAKVA